MSIDRSNEGVVLSLDVTMALPEFSVSVDETIPLGGCMALFGPSGAGKSTLLHIIAGLKKPDKARIAFGPERNPVIWQDTEGRIFTPPHRRRIGVVFQNSRLFPHLTVEENILYADKRYKDEDKRYSRHEIIKAFDLAPLLQRHPAALSGGEAQRVAMARALLTRPDLLLLDEPLSALDQRRKADIAPYLEDLPARFGAPVIYVSHQLDEVLRLADTTAIMTAGRIEAVGPTADILNAYGVHNNDADQWPDPWNGRVQPAILEAVVSAHNDAHLLTQVSLGDGTLSLPINKAKKIGETVLIRVDAHHVAIATKPPEGLSIRNVLPAVVSDIQRHQNDPFTDVTLKAGDHDLRAQITLASVEDLNLAPGASVFALIKSASFNL